MVHDFRVINFLFSSLFASFSCLFFVSVLYTTLIINMECIQPWYMSQSSFAQLKDFNGRFYLVELTLLLIFLSCRVRRDPIDFLPFSTSHLAKTFFSLSLVEQIVCSGILSSSLSRSLVRILSSFHVIFLKACIYVYIYLT